MASGIKKLLVCVFIMFSMATQLAVSMDEPEGGQSASKWGILGSYAGRVNNVLARGKQLFQTTRQYALPATFLANEAVMGMMMVVMSPQDAMVIPVIDRLNMGWRCAENLCGAAKSIRPGNSIAARLTKACLYGLGAYLTLSVPVAAAQSTSYSVNLGPQFQINQNQVGGSTTSTFCFVDKNNNDVCGTAWASVYSFVVGRLYYTNGTFVTPEFNVSTTNISGPVGQIAPSCALINGTQWGCAFTNGNQILVTTFDLATRLMGPLQVNTPHASQGGASFAGSGNRFCVAWGYSDPGSYVNAVVCGNVDGTGLTSPTIIDQQSTPIGYPQLVALLGQNSGKFGAMWGRATSLLYNMFDQSATLLGTPQVVSPSPFGAGGPPAATPDGGAICVYPKGFSTILARRMNGTGYPTGPEMVLVNGTTQAESPMSIVLNNVTWLLSWLGFDAQSGGLNDFGAPVSSNEIYPSLGIPSDSVGGIPSGAPFQNRGGGFITWVNSLYQYIYGSNFNISQNLNTTSANITTSTTISALTSSTGAIGSSTTSIITTSGAMTGVNTPTPPTTTSSSSTSTSSVSTAPASTTTTTSSVLTTTGASPAPLTPAPSSGFTTPTPTHQSVTSSGSSRMSNWMLSPKNIISFFTGNKNS